MASPILHVRMLYLLVVQAFQTLEQTFFPIPIKIITIPIIIKKTQQIDMNILSEEELSFPFVLLNSSLYENPELSF